MPDLRYVTAVAGAVLLTASAAAACGKQATPTVSTPVQTQPSSSVMTETPSTVAPGTTLTETPTERTDTGEAS